LAALLDPGVAETADLREQDLEVGVIEASDAGFEQQM